MYIICEFGLWTGVVCEQALGNGGGSGIKQDICL